MSFLNLSGVQSEDKYALLPEGKYTLRCNEAEVCDTKAGNGRYIKCQFKTDNNKVVYHMFNIENPNPKAVEIGLGQLKNFLKGSGYHNHEELGALKDLLGLKCECMVKIKVDEKFGDKNIISSFSDKPVKKDEDNVPF